MITIELDIFSGRPNPTWTLTNKEENELFSRAMADKDMTAPPRKVGHLGYRGFSIKIEGEQANRWHAAGLRRRFYVSEGHGREGDTEKFLLNTDNAGQTTKDNVLQAAQEYIDAANNAWTQRWIQADHAENGPPPMPANPHEPLVDGTIIVPDYDGRGTPSTGEDQMKGEAASDSMSALACGAISYTSHTNFTYWNSDSYVMANNNCYNFAANCRNNTFAQPGRKSNVQVTELACGNSPGQVGYAAAYDGFTGGCWTSTQYYTALVIWPNTDFHWYRQCTSGYWCHKPGGTAARNIDQSFQLITNPLTCDRGPYTLFCSWRYFPTNYTVR